jgi:hypothetical protein
VGAIQLKSEDFSEIFDDNSGILPRPTPEAFLSITPVFSAEFCVSTGLFNLLTF